MVASGGSVPSGTPPKMSSSSDPRGRSRGGAAAKLQRWGPLVITVETVEHGPFKQTFLEIRRRRPEDEVRLVTAIEILSPSNADYREGESTRSSRPSIAVSPPCSSSSC